MIDMYMERILRGERDGHIRHFPDEETNLDADDHRHSACSRPCAVN